MRKLKFRFKSVQVFYSVEKRDQTSSFYERNLLKIFVRQRELRPPKRRTLVSTSPEVANPELQDPWIEFQVSTSHHFY